MNSDADQVDSQKMEQKKPQDNKYYKLKLAFRAILNSFILLLILGVCFFLGKGDFNYKQAWIYIGLFYSMMFCFMVYMVIKDPELLERRLQRKEERQTQKWYIMIANFMILGIYLLPGLEQRFLETYLNMPNWIWISADIIFALSYIWFTWVLRTNSFAARTVRVEEKQKVITTGPYKIVRHPLYLGAFIMFSITPLCLGSYLGLFSIPFLVIVLVMRTLDEEEMLKEELDGYTDYMKKTKYRIIPGLW